MNNQFDELTKSLAQSVTRRGALKQFGGGLIGLALACFGFAGRARAGNHNRSCFNNCMHTCVDNLVAQGYTKDQATTTCQQPCTVQCSF